ncbi:hypothetical protein CQA66_08425 [Helicobacter aurati]|uniref:Phage tail tape measure protein n=1 Tax=Helicobacter aurati TaxID=137778 RepID=A0A3D8J0Q2_9HELI|nr:hypothetical protein [Helicobacter aurati]RDU70424.1 hypothetical protein CQA66_08425 [Helicobacter aurati]
MAGNVLKEFIVSFNAKISPLMDGLKKASGGFNDLANNVSKVAGLIGAALGGAVAINAAAKMGEELQNFADLTGIAADDAKNLGDILGKFGGSASDAMNDLKNLNTAFYQATKGEGALVDATLEYGKIMSNQGGRLQNTRQAMSELADKMSKMNKQAALALGQKLGLSDATIRLLMQGKKGVDDLYKSQSSLGNITKEEIQSGKDFSNMLKDVKFFFEKISMVLLNALMPIMKKVHSIFTAFIKILNRNGWQIVKILGIVAGILVGIKITMIAISVASKAMFAPFNLVIVIIIAILLVIDDIVTYFRGGKSLIGKWIESNETLRGVVEKLKDLWDWICGTVETIKEYFENLTLDKLLSDVKEIGANIGKWFGKKIGFISEDDVQKAPISNKNINNSNTTNNNTNNNNNVSINQNIVTNNPKQLANDTNKELATALKSSSAAGY